MRTTLGAVASGAAIVTGASLARDATNSIQGSSTTDGTTFSTASITPASGSLVLVAVAAEGTASFAAPTSIAGDCNSNVSTIQSITYNSVAAPQNAVVLYA
jgi:hypothetical protein